MIHISNELLVSRIYRKLSKLNNKKTTTNLKMGNILHLKLHQKGYKQKQTNKQTKKHMKICLLAIREMQIESLVRITAYPLRMVNFFFKDNTGKTIH